MEKWYVAVLSGGAAAMVLYQDLIMKIALELYPSYKDTIYLQTETGLAGNLMSILRCVAVLVLALVCYKESWKDDEKNQIYIKLNFLAVLLYLCGSFLPLVGRIGYYLITCQILLIPSILGSIKEEKKKKILTAVVIIACVIYFLLFLKSANQPGVRVLPYKSWLFFEKEFLNAETIF